MDKLTPKQETFVQKYLECGNAYEACQHVYYVGKDISPEATLKKVGKLLSNPGVRARLLPEHKYPLYKPNLTGNT